MPDCNTCLGLCFFGNQLFYAVRSNDKSSHFRHIGAIDFNFEVSPVLFGDATEGVQGVRENILTLIERFEVSLLRVLVHANMECWAILPKLVYDDASEREAYINILMNGQKREHIYTFWHTLSKNDFKLLNLRTAQSLQGLQTVTAGTSEVDFVSAFNIGEEWVEHVHPGGSFLTVGSFENCISVSSFILGKLRGATFITFDDPEDLPYLWLQKAGHLPWMHGLHEQIMVYGQHARNIIDILEPFWEDDGEIINMDSLKKMQVQAREQTYGFELARAYPAIMLALG